MTLSFIFTTSSCRRIALKQLQVEKPAYRGGSDEWWGEVIRRTAIGAGANSNGMHRGFIFVEVVPL